MQCPPGRDEREPNMKSILSYDSKLMVMLGHLADIMMLNLVFLVSCLPVITIGAAFTAMHSASRAVAEQRAWFKGYWRTFAGSFLRSTLAYVIMLIPTGGAVWAAIVCWNNKQTLPNYMPAFICACIAVVVLMSVAQMCLLFYSRFEVGVGRLVKNGFLMVLAYPIRSLLIGVASWAPIWMFFLEQNTFSMLTPVWLLLYSATVSSVSVWLMKRPFETLIRDMEELEAAIAEYEAKHTDQQE